MNRLSSPVRLLLVALALGIGYDLLFYGRALGISLLIFALLALGALFALGRLEGVKPARRNLWLIAPLVFFAAMAAVRANPFVSFLNVCAVLALLGLVAYLYAAGRVERLGLLGYPVAFAATVGNALFRAAPLVRDSVNVPALREQGKRNLLPVLRGCLLSLPVLLLFTCLLASADLIFAKYVKDVVELRILHDLAQYLWRGLLVLVVGWLLAGGLAYALMRRETPWSERLLGQASAGLGRLVRLGFVETVVTLISVDLLFLLFVWVQFAYLFGGQANITLEGFTYAEYVHRGFGELVAVSILTLALILGLRRLARRETGRQICLFNALSSLMMVLVLVILASAFQRLRLYEQAYGYTELRLYVYIFMAWLGGVLAWFTATLWWRADRFAVGAFIAALGFLVTLNLINPDAFIARQNLARFRATHKIDVVYLASLSEDAVPVLVGALDQVEGWDQALLAKLLVFQRESMEENGRWRGWASWHLARVRAYNVLVESQAKMEGLQAK